MSLVLVVLIPFLGAIFPALLIRSGRNTCATAAATVNILSLALLLSHAPVVFSGGVVQSSWYWLPQANLDASFFLDGLGFLFAGMILTIGLMVIIYARFYLSKKDPMGNFYMYLLLFQGAMVGIVTSNNILLMLVFWEITSLSSFLLIGFWSHTAAGRQGARMALTVTGLGGLALLAGFLLLGGVSGSYELTDILSQNNVVSDSQYYVPILVLVLLGCFTKSAQFPFHFWLPHAMAAPTPVSAYLHSATMVKAGIFLMARLLPVLSGTEEWFYIVSTVGLVTMIFGATVALFRDDLKSLLAFSTISQLGMMTMLLGIGTGYAVVACVFHIINHAAFKAALFMNVGIIDHEVGSRDMAHLGGLRKLMPITAVIGIFTAASMAGLPPFGGFLSKEMMLEVISHTDWAGLDWFFPVFVTIGATASAAYSFRYMFFVFLGPIREKYPSHPHDPDMGMWLPSALFMAMVILFGLFPESWAGGLVTSATNAIMQAEGPEFHPALWHGWTPAVTMSAIAVGISLFMVTAYKPLRLTWDIFPKIEAKKIYDELIKRVVQVSHVISSGIHNGSLQRMVFILIIAVTGLAAVTFVTSDYMPGQRELTSANAIVCVGWFMVLGCCGLVCVIYRNRLLALITVNVVGLISSLAFILLSAPDLALTQISVEVVTLILMLLALYFLPKESIGTSGSIRLIRDTILSICVGAGIGFLAWTMMTRDAQSLSGYYIDQAIPGSGGANVVNVILVDFRGFDTFGEIMVVGIAAMIIYAMLEGMLTGKVATKLSDWQLSTPLSPNRHPLIMVVVTRVMLPLSIMVAVFIFVRGHNMPGGGFIAALMVSIAIIMQYMASGYGWAAKQIKVNYHALIGGGVLIAAGTGIGAMVFGLPFLTSWHDHLHIPILGDVELSSAMAFDLGVFLTVVGGVMLALANFSYIGRVASKNGVDEGPMDYDPSDNNYWSVATIESPKTTGEAKDDKTADVQAGGS